MSEGPGEIITLGVGNFGSLCAAHWCNSLTRYDAEHDVVFCHRKTQAYPRLVLLDSHQPSVIKDLGDEAPTSIHADGSLLAAVGFRNYGSPDDTGDVEEDEEEETDSDDEAPERSAQHADPAATQETKPMKQSKLFSKKVENVPWWKYIVTELHSKSVVCCDSQHQTTEGEIGLNAFGYGEHASSFHRADSTFSQFYENLRYFLEDCDRCQGVQVFADCNSAFGGLSHKLAQLVKDDFGRSFPLAIHAAQLPPRAQGQHDGEDKANSDFVKKEQGCFNKLWSTHRLSSAYDIYCPLHVEDMLPSGVYPWDEIDYAAYLSMATDTALYPCRDDVKNDDPDAGDPQYLSMGSLAGLLRPSNGMRVVGLFSKQLIASDHMPDLWDVFSANPLLSDKYTACSYPFPTDSFLTDEGMVLGHLLSLRGLSKFPGKRYPQGEAVLRYALPLRTSRFHSSMTGEAYPLSASFPSQVVDHLINTQVNIGNATAQKPRESVANDGDVPASSKIKNVLSASHLVNSNGCAPYLKGMVAEGRKVIHHRHHHQALYGYEGDEWQEMFDDVMAVRDEYDHAPPSDDDDNLEQ